LPTYAATREIKQEFMVIHSSNNPSRSIFSELNSAVTQSPVVSSSIPQTSVVEISSPLLAADALQAKSAASVTSAVEQSPSNLAPAHNHASTVSLLNSVAPSTPSAADLLQAESSSATISATDPSPANIEPTNNPPSTVSLLNYVAPYLVDTSDISEADTSSATISSNSVQTPETNLFLSVVEKNELWNQVMSLNNPNLNLQNIHESAPLPSFKEKSKIKALEYIINYHYRRHADSHAIKEYVIDQLDQWEDEDMSRENLYKLREKALKYIEKIVKPRNKATSSPSVSATSSKDLPSTSVAATSSAALSTGFKNKKTEKFYIVDDSSKSMDARIKAYADLIKMQDSAPALPSKELEDICEMKTSSQTVKSVFGPTNRPFNLEDSEGREFFKNNGKFGIDLDYTLYKVSFHNKIQKMAVCECHRGQLLDHYLADWGSEKTYAPLEHLSEQYNLYLQAIKEKKEKKLLKSKEKLIEKFSKSGRTFINNY
jgi:hypothetical protein